VLEVELGVVDVEGVVDGVVVVVVTVVGVVVVGVVGMVVSGLGVVVIGVVVGVVEVVVLIVVVLVVMVVVVVFGSVVVSEGVVVVGLLGSSPGPSQDLKNSLGDTGSEDTSADTDWQTSDSSSYFTNTQPGTARHGSQSLVGLQSAEVGVEGAIVVVLDGVVLGGVVLGGVEGVSVGRAKVWHPRARQSRKYPSMMVVRLFLSLSISQHYQIALVWSGTSFWSQVV